MFDSWYTLQSFNESPISKRRLRKDHKQMNTNKPSLTVGDLIIFDNSIFADGKNAIKTTGIVISISKDTFTVFWSLNVPQPFTPRNATRIQTRHFYSTDWKVIYKPEQLL